MVHDKIALLLKDIAKVKEELSGIKKDIKIEETIEDEQYLQLKKALKELKAQVKDKQDEHMSELASDDHYNKLRELRLKAEEELAHANEALFKVLDELPKKYFEIQIDTENGPVKVQVQPEMKIFLNGKEEKKRV
ncbi:hypothetical protein COU74_04390 [Candidatus Peregrinibacteria bacterium CG10_big_fil_rev_8_21_14_0_10_36_19]|nr:MAG: hypothetical protein COU74_04390 [Candidatus Peregrinibacteria bacterium CG10_big_fil_rev_8_21_14_0_10_36_19]